MPRSLLKKWSRKEKPADQARSGNLVTLMEPTSVVSEAYRTLRTSLVYALVDTPPKVIVVTSSGPGEGKSTTCANLGVVLAQADKSTLLLDCDLRRPTLHKIFELYNLRGVVDALVGRYTLPDLWQETLPNLKVVAAGPNPPNPAELLGSRRFIKLIEQAREEFDYVLIDTPPLVPVSDALVLATEGDGVILVFDPEKTRKRVLRPAMLKLEAVGATVLGTVMNNAELGTGTYYYNYAYHE